VGMHKLIALALALVVPLAACGSAATSTPAPKTATATAPVAEPPESSRFDLEVRDDFFAGFTGDLAALDRGMKRCEDELAKNPDHAEALVWHGAGLLFQAGQAFQTGDAARGTELWQRGLAEENRAVAIAPEDVAVRIPRGAVFLNMAPFVPDPTTKKSLLETGVGDYEKTLALQAAYFTKLSEHAQGQLLWGLADGWDQLGADAKARAYYQRIARDLPGTDYAERANLWLAGTPSTEPAPCGECHAAPGRASIHP
jgi:hypothetical protein